MRAECDLENAAGEIRDEKGKRVMVIRKVKVTRGTLRWSNSC